MYAHGQATIALCELYGMTKDSLVRQTAQRAVDFASEAQSPEGGWRYVPRRDSDLSVTGWFVMALVSAKSAGLRLRGGEFEKAWSYLNSIQHDEGATYGYQALRPPSSSMTAEGLVSRMYMGWALNNPNLALGVETLLEQAPFSYQERNFYYWYYGTQVMHHYGGTAWDRWNYAMRAQLPAAQVKSGKEAGSWAPQGDVWGDNIGRLYTTCMGIYCLEVYYRHMPLYTNPWNKTDEK
jgi:hypothetical protein